MHRRQFLQASAGAVGLTAARQTSTLPIVIVGAGLAGLQAATVLRDAGRPVIVLEARRVPGGRVLTIRAPFDEGLFGEAGAVRIAPQHERVQRLVAAHRLPLVPFISTNGSAVVRTGGVTARTPEEIARLAAPLSLRVDEQGLTQGALLRRYAGSVIDEMAQSLGDEATSREFDRYTWPDWLRSRGASPGAVTLMTLGGDSRELSALYVLRQLAPLHATTQYFKIHGGMDQLPHAMAEALGSLVRYGAVVGRIGQAADRVEVEYRAQGTLRRLAAGRVILAVPFSTLGQLHLQPVLSGPVAAAMQAVRYFPAVRVLLQTGDRFWHAQDLNGSARTDDPAEMWDCSYDLPAGRGLIGLTIGGAIGRQMATLTRARALEQAVALAARTFPALRTYYEKGTIYRWLVDPWAQGAFSVFYPGGGSATMPGVYQPVGRLHFAGEHTSAASGWMEGALESGERAAAEVMAALAERRDARG